MKMGSPFHASRKALLKATVAGAVLCASAVLVPAMADEAAPAADAAAPAADPSAIKLTAMIETGATFAANTHHSDVNYGHLFTDKNDQMVLNQAALTLNRDLDPKAEGFDWGFKLQGFYGTDARYTHFIGMFDESTKSRNQFDIVEANALAHLPVLTEGGIDAKVGLYSTPLGAEVIQPNNNYLYSHSYIFNFGLPLKHTGGYLTTHVNSTLDVITGADTGWNETIGHDGTVNNGGASELGGFGLNGLLDGKLTILALSHVGPQYPSNGPFGNSKANSRARQTYDVVATYKASDTLTFITEGDYVREDVNGAKAFGLAQYAVYAMTPVVSLVGRGEVFSDKQNYFVSAFPANRDPVQSERGQTPDQSIISPAAGTTYGELTLGLNITPEGLPAMLTGTVIRPEVRFDSTLNGVKAYNNTTSAGQISAGLDVVIPISLF